MKLNKLTNLNLQPFLMFYITYSFLLFGLDIGLERRYWNPHCQSEWRKTRHRCDADAYSFSRNYLCCNSLYSLMLNMLQSSGNMGGMM